MWVPWLVILFVVLTLMLAAALLLPELDDNATTGLLEMLGAGARQLRDPDRREAIALGRYALDQAL